MRIPLNLSLSYPHHHPVEAGLAQAAFLRGGDLASAASGGRESWQGLSPEARLQASLMSWRFPDSPWDTDTIRALLQVWRGVEKCGEVWDTDMIRAL